MGWLNHEVDLVFVFEEISCLLLGSSNNLRFHGQHLRVTFSPNLCQHLSFFILSSCHSNWGFFFSGVPWNFLCILATPSFAGYLCVSYASSWRPQHLPYIGLPSSLLILWWAFTESSRMDSCLESWFMIFVGKSLKTKTLDKSSS